MLQNFKQKFASLSKQYCALSFFQYSHPFNENIGNVRSLSGHSVEWYWMACDNYDDHALSNSYNSTISD